MGIKVAVGGPPHSGKSVFLSLLRGLLPREQFAMVEGAPDGEGITGWSHEGDAELSRAIRRKGKFLVEFVDWVARSVRGSTAPVTLVDLGGIRSPENERILRECTHFIVLATPKYEAEVAPWIDFGKACGCEPLAVLESVLEGADDEIFSAGTPLRARITRLDRENPPVGSPTARAVAQRILELAGRGNAEDTGEADAGANFPRLAELLGLPLRNGGPGRDWIPSCLPQLLSVVLAETAGQLEVRLWGNCSAGFPYHALACAVAARVSFYDPKLAGYVELPALAIAGEGNNLLAWRREERDDHSLVEYGIPGQVFDVPNLPVVIPPTVPTDRGVVVSGKGPWWLTGAICRAYHRASVAWVAVFTPQESARLLADGRAWAELHPGCGPAVVVASRDAATPVGTVVPFRL